MYGLKNPAITRLWRNTQFACLQCREEESDIHYLEPYDQNGKIFYRCSNCGFMIPYYEIEKVIDKIIKMLTDDDDEEIVLKNVKWSAIEKNAGIRYEYRILSHKRDRITVGIQKIQI